MPFYLRLVQGIHRETVKFSSVFVIPRLIDLLIKLLISATARRQVTNLMVLNFESFHANADDIVFLFQFWMAPVFLPQDVTIFFRLAIYLSLLVSS